MSRLIEYIDVLKLDNFLQTLTFEERLQLNQYPSKSNGRSASKSGKTTTLD